MKKLKNALSLALALAMCLGLVIPAFALEITADGVGGPSTPVRDFKVSISAKDESSLKLETKSFQIRNWNHNKETNVVAKGADETLALTQVFALPAGAEIVIESTDGYIPDDSMECQAWSDPDGDGIYDARINKTDYLENEEGVESSTNLLDASVSGPLTNVRQETPNECREVNYTTVWGMSCEGTIYFFTMGYGGGIEGKPATISADYLIKKFGSNTLFCLKFYRGYDSTADKNIYTDYYFLLTDKQPVEPITPAKSETAMPTNDKLTVNGEAQNPTVYKINGNNYFKIRDLAAVLNGTEKQFDVDYDGALKSVTATTGKSYTKLDTDLAGAATGGNQTADPSNDTIYIDGQKVDAAVYKINGNNYFKLRDLGQALDFYVGWTKEDGVFIDTSKPYSE